MASPVSVYLPDYGYTYCFSGVLSVKHEPPLNIQKDGESLYHTDYVNGARNEPNKIVLEVIELDIGHPAGWATRIPCTAPCPAMSSPSIRKPRPPRSSRRRK